MVWRVIINAEDGMWAGGDVVPIDSESGWAEAWDEAFPGYRKTVYEAEADANAAARQLRAWGYSAATEPVPDDEPARS